MIISQQVFPGSTLIREKLELNASGNNSFSLNKLNDRLHFQFPKYGIKSLDKNPVSTEIRLASWELKPITFKSNNPKRNQNHMYYPDVITNEIEDELNEKARLIFYLSAISAGSQPMNMPRKTILMGC